MINLTLYDIFREANNTIQDIQIYNRISVFLDIESICYMTKISRIFRSEHFMIIAKKRLSTLIIKGLNPADQYIYWNHFVDFKYLQQRYALQFSVLK